LGPNGVVTILAGGADRAEPANPWPRGCDRCVTGYL